MHKIKKQPISAQLLFILFYSLEIVLWFIYEVVLIKTRTVREDMTKLINKVVIVNDRRTSIRLCHKEWEALDEVCNMENISKNDLLSLIENGKRNSLGLTYSARLFIIEYFRQAATTEGHLVAKHCISDGWVSLRQNIQKSIND